MRVIVAPWGMSKQQIADTVKTTTLEQYARRRAMQNPDQPPTLPTDFIVVPLQRRTPGRADCHLVKATPHIKARTAEGQVGGRFLRLGSTPELIG